MDFELKPVGIGRKQCTSLLSPPAPSRAWVRLAIAVSVVVSSLLLPVSLAESGCYITPCLQALSTSLLLYSELFESTGHADRPLEWKSTISDFVAQNRRKWLKWSYQPYLAPDTLFLHPIPMSERREWREKKQGEKHQKTEKKLKNARETTNHLTSIPLEWKSKV